jgi:hypothetical protein
MSATEFHLHALVRRDNHKNLQVLDQLHCPVLHLS